MLLINSAKSPMESLSTLASRACGTLDRNLELPGGGLVCRVGFEFKVLGGFDRSPLSLLAEEERDRLLAGRGTAWAFILVELLPFGLSRA